jgi:GxxExxY protein
MDPEPPRLILEEQTGAVIREFYSVYNELGGGFPEFVYRRAMALALRGTGLAVSEEVPLPVWFRGNRIVTFRADLVVSDQVLVEVKALPEVDRFQQAQVLHYLKASDLEVGLLLNFGRRPEFKRVIYENRRKQRPPLDDLQSSA